MKSVLALLVFFGASTVFADNIVCKGKNRMGSAVQVEIAEDSVTLSGAGLLGKKRVIKDLTRVNGLITGPGLAITMDDDYGCLHNAVIIAEFTPYLNQGYMEVVNVNTCSGGSTPDAICQPSK